MSDEHRIILGIDIGGSGIKGAPVDVHHGELVDDRLRIKTPQPATPDAVAEVVGEIAAHFDWKGLIGAAFPAIIKDGVAYSAANVDDSWIGANGRDLFEKATGCRVRLINDADAAGNAEMRFGIGADVSGVVMMLTLGTGIGSALFTDGRLVPNTELGHLEFKGMEAEHYAAESIREREDLSWEEWGKRVDEYLNYVNFLFSPDLIIIGGGISKKFDKYSEYFTVKTKVAAAEMRNEAGIIGAALTARELA